MKQKSYLFFGIIVLIGIVLISGCVQQIEKGPKTEKEVEKIPQELCETDGGTWKEFTNDGEFCHDECGKPESVICTKFMSLGCDCGIDKCWDGTSCISETTKTQQEPIVDIVELCEIEDPRFNPSEECQKVVNEKYSGRKCSFELGPTQWLPLGSCRNCTIRCK